MSSVWTVIISGVIALLGVLLGLSYNEYRNRQERKDRYRVLTFEKRLQVHQEALSQIYKLIDVVHNNNISSDDKLVAMRNLMHWWEDNQLLLDENSRRHIQDLYHAAGEHVSDPKVKRSLFGKEWRETRKALYEGIGLEHLRDTHYNEELDEI